MFFVFIHYPEKAGNSYQLAIIKPCTKVNPQNTVNMHLARSNHDPQGISSAGRFLAFQQVAEKGGCQFASI